MNCFYRETGGVGSRNGKTERFIAGNGRYPGGTSGEITEQIPGEKAGKRIAGLRENNPKLGRIRFILAQNKKETCGEGGGLCLSPLTALRTMIVLFYLSGGYRIGGAR